MGEAIRRRQLGLEKQFNVNTEWDNLKERVCPHCGGRIFSKDALFLRIIPALLSPTGMPETAMHPAGFVCLNCGQVIPLRPTEEETKAEKKVILAKGGKA